MLTICHTILDATYIIFPSPPPPPSSPPLSTPHIIIIIINTIIGKKYLVINLCFSYDRRFKNVSQVYLLDRVIKDFCVAAYKDKASKRYLTPIPFA